MQMMFTVAEMGSGGAEAVVEQLARDVKTSGVSATVASSGGWRVAELARHGVSLVSVPLRGRRSLDLARVVVRLRQEHARAPADLVHAHNVKSALVAAAAFSAAHRQRIPIVVTLHGVPNDRYRDAARILRCCTDELVAVSDDVAVRVAAGGFPTSRMRVIENAVAVPPSHDRVQARTRLGIPRDALVALCVARLAPQKRHDILVASWQLMPPGSILLIAGEGATRSAIEAAIRSTGQGDRIRLLGERRDVDWLLAAADVFALPTDWEGLPISVLEAMAAGVPVVASAVSGLSSFGSDAVELVHPGTPAALADGLRHVLFDDQWRGSLVATGLRLTRERFAPEQMWRRYRSLYASLSAPFAAQLGEVKA